MSNEVKEIAYPDSNRIGRLNFTFEMLREEREMVGALLALCVVLDVEDHESGRGKVYTCACPMFDELREGEEIPEYRIECARPGHLFERDDHQAKRTNAPFGYGFVAVRKIIVRVPPLQIGTRAHGTVH